MRECSQCHIEFDENDHLFKIRTAKHEEWHKRSTYFGLSTSPRPNIEVQWIPK